MRKPLVAAFLALTVLVPASMSAQREARMAVQQVISAFADGIHSNRLADVDALFAPSGVHIILDNETLHGWGEYRDQYLKTEMARYPNLRYAHTGVESSVRGNIAWAAFRWQMSSAGNGPAPILGRGSAVLEKIEGQWRIAHLHLSR